MQLVLWVCIPQSLEHTQLFAALLKKKVFLMKNALREAKISSSMLHHGVYSDKDSRFRSDEGIWPIISTPLWIIKVLFSPRYPVPWVLTQWFCHLLYFTQIKSFIMYLWVCPLLLVLYWEVFPCCCRQLWFFKFIAA